MVTQHDKTKRAAAKLASVNHARPADRLLPGAQAPTISQARAASGYAGACPADGDPECVQRPGGIGFTWGHPAHLYLKRAEASSVLCGTRAHRAALAGLVNLPGPGA